MKLLSVIVVVPDPIFCTGQAPERSGSAMGVVLRLLKDLLRAWNAVRRWVLNCSLNEFGIPLKLGWLINVCSNHTNSNTRTHISNIWERHYRTNFAFTRELRTDEFLGAHEFFFFFVLIFYTLRKTWRLNYTKI